MDELAKTEDQPKLFMVLLGSKAPGHTVEQHDFYFGIATSLKELIPDLKAFWPEAGNSHQKGILSSPKACKSYDLQAFMFLALLYY